MGESVDDVPALLVGGREVGADQREVHRPLQRPKAAGDFFGGKLHHARVAFGLIVGEWNSRVMKESQRVVFACREAQEEIVSGSARRAAAPLPPRLIAAHTSGAWASWKTVTLRREGHLTAARNNR